jgi:hypothetical protein
MKWLEVMNSSLQGYLMKQFEHKKSIDAKHQRAFMQEMQQVKMN